MQVAFHAMQLFPTTKYSIQNLENAIFTNCIFMNNATIEAGSSGGNSFFGCMSRLGTVPAANGSSGNFNNTNPNFVTYTLGSLYSTSHDYHLQPGSPAIGTGTSGTDIGVHGGTSNFSETGEVLITPIIRLLNIINNTVQPNGTLNVQINATKPTDH